MADFDESDAVGAEKSPKKVGAFVLTLLVLVVLVLGLTILFVHAGGSLTGR